jgi:hypothetical protein
LKKCCGNVLEVDSVRKTEHHITTLQHPLQLTLHDSINGASLLAEAAVDALCHVNVVTGRAAGSVETGLGLDSDSLSGADGLAQLAGNAALLAVGVPPQRVLSTETGREGTLLEGVHDGVRGAEELLEDDPHACKC